MWRGTCRAGVALQRKSPAPRSSLSSQLAVTHGQAVPATLCGGDLAICCVVLLSPQGISRYEAERGSWVHPWFVWEVPVHAWCSLWAVCPLLS